MNPDRRQRPYWSLLLLFFTPAVFSFDIGNGAIWPEGETTFHVRFPDGEDGLTAAQLETAFREAMDEWTNRSVFRYKADTNPNADPCNDPNNDPIRNGAKFSSEDCGDMWDSNTLAITRTWTNSQNEIIQSGIVLNSNIFWDIYSGPLQVDRAEFRRIAVHELGHVLGLGHTEDNPDTASLCNSPPQPIMCGFISNNEIPQPDDLTGIGALYDSDGDGIGLADDNCPSNANANQDDSDGDGQGDACDADIDGDGVFNDNDNCPLDPNANQVDSNDNGFGDVCDDDTDGDGMPDDFETANGLDPQDPSDARADNDGDSLDNLTEFQNGTDPNNPDTDGDGVDDDVEINSGRNPRVNESNIISIIINFIINE